MSNHVTQGQWRPNLYPAQTFTGQACSDSSTLMSESDESLPLPKSIHAFQDSRAPHSPGRSIVICLDGTGDKFDNDNSNVVKFVACLKKDSPNQITYYQSGIGTYDGHGLTKGWSAAVDMAVGSGLGVHIKDAYSFIMENYCEGDKICLLGFSRGSYTVRCLAGMLHKVGLLPAQNQAQVSFAYNFYKDDTPEGWKMSAEFKKTFCTDVSVYFVGIWDCVASVGFFPRTLPFSKSPTNSIAYFRHAMALDEHRAKFKVCQYQRQDPGVAPQVDDTSKARIESHLTGGRPLRQLSLRLGSRRNTGEKHTMGRRLSISSDLTESKEEKDQAKLEQVFEKDDRSIHESPPTDVLEVWFAGAHADCGGGAVPNETRHVLSRIPLRWMIRQCFVCNTGILFDTTALAEVGIDIPTIWPVYKAHKKPVVGPSPTMLEQYEAGELPPLQRRSSVLGVDKIKKLGKGEDLHTQDQPRQEELLPEQVEDHFDAIASINDQLVQARGWWILEFWPVKVRVQKKADEWVKVVRMNLGRFRPIEDTEPNLHWTVQLRMKEKGYKIRNTIEKDVFWDIVA